jgi:hypothetical protein
MEHFNEYNKRKVDYRKISLNLLSSETELSKET